MQIDAKILHGRSPFWAVPSSLPGSLPQQGDRLISSGTFKPTIEISERKGEDPRLLVGTGDLVNQYRNLAIAAESFGAPPIDIRQEYRDGLNDKKAEIPPRDPMTDALSENIKKEAGAR
jgi:hypothetical protein